MNNGGKNNKYKNDIQEIIMDFLDEPKNSTRRTN